jgi:hypothetical protein
MFKLISESRLKELSIINGNVDSKLIGPMIIEVQEMHILPILGTALYREIGSQVPTLTALNKTLVDDYVIPCMIKYIQQEACIDLNFKLTNANVSQKNTDESTPVDIATSFKLSDRFKNKAEWYAERLTLYLIANQSDYPLYTQPGTSIDTIHPRRDNYTCGMVLDSYCSCNKSTCIQCQTNMQTSPQ